MTPPNFAPLIHAPAFDMIDVEAFSRRIALVEETLRACDQMIPYKDPRVGQALPSGRNPLIDVGQVFSGAPDGAILSVLRSYGSAANGGHKLSIRRELPNAGAITLAIKMAREDAMMRIDRDCAIYLLTTMREAAQILASRLAQHGAGAAPEHFTRSQVAVEALAALLPSAMESKAFATSRRTLTINLPDLGMPTRATVHYIAPGNVGGRSFNLDPHTMKALDRACSPARRLSFRHAKEAAESIYEIERFILTFPISAHEPGPVETLRLMAILDELDKLPELAPYDPKF